MMVWIVAQINAADGFALAMLGVIALAMGTLALLFYCMKRNVARRDPHVDALLEELENEEREASRDTRTEPTVPSDQPWERDGNWWKEN